MRRTRASAVPRIRHAASRACALTERGFVGGSRQLRAAALIAGSPGRHPVANQLAHRHGPCDGAASHCPQRWAGRSRQRGSVSQHAQSCAATTSALTKPGSTSRRREVEREGRPRGLVACFRHRAGRCVSRSPAVPVRRARYRPAARLGCRGPRYPAPATGASSPRRPAVLRARCEGVSATPAWQAARSATHGLGPTTSVDRRPQRTVHLHLVRR